MTTNEKLAALMTKRNLAGENLYARAKLADEVMRDSDWIAREHNGDYWSAEKYIETEFFGDVCGVIQIGHLREILRHFPDISDWKAAKFHLADLYAKVRAIKKESDAGALTRRSVKLADHQKVVEDKERLEAKVSELSTECISKNGQVSNLAEKNAELRREIEQLRKENKLLRKRVAELEAMTKNPSKNGKHQLVSAN